MECIYLIFLKMVHSDSHWKLHDYLEICGINTHNMSQNILLSDTVNSFPFFGTNDLATTNKSATSYFYD